MPVHFTPVKQNEKNKRRRIPMNYDPLEVLKKSDLPLYTEISTMQELAYSDGELSKKHKLLIALAIDTANHAENGIRSLALQAIENGATKNEIMETLRIVNYICGAGSMYPAAAALKDIL